MAKMTIYIPDDLKEQMDEHGEGKNWSEIAQSAFRASLPAQAQKSDFDVAYWRKHANPAMNIDNLFWIVGDRRYLLTDLLHPALEEHIRSHGGAPQGS